MWCLVNLITLEVRITIPNSHFLVLYPCSRVGEKMSHHTACICSDFWDLEEWTLLHYPWLISAVRKIFTTYRTLLSKTWGTDFLHSSHSANCCGVWKCYNNSLLTQIGSTRTVLHAAVVAPCLLYPPLRSPLSVMFSFNFCSCNI